MTRRRVSVCLVVIPAMLAAACGERPAAPAAASRPAGSAPATQAAATPAAPGEFKPLPESTNWSAAEAFAHLNDESPVVTRSAALRLLALSGLAPACLPAVLSEESAASLRVVELSESLYVFGRELAPGHLACPVLLSSPGTAQVPYNADAGFADFFVSDDADLFPHVLVAAGAVRIAADELRDAIVAADLGPARFTVLREERRSFVALVLPGDPPDTPREIARYRWDPFELMFMGPASDAFPADVGGRFVIDLHRSPALVPVGGEIPASAPNLPATTEDRPASQPVPPW